MFVISTEWWNALSTIDQIFWGIAVIFTVLFLIQFVLSLFGLDFDTDADMDMNLDHDYSLDPSFALLSVRSLIAFCTFFGWAGVLALGKGFSSTWVILIAAGSGFAAMILVAYLMYFFSRLSETGTADLNEIIYKNGTVYLTIPGRRKGVGKVHVTIKNSLHELDAVTEGDDLENGQTVKIVEILDNDVLVVEPIEIFEK